MQSRERTENDSCVVALSGPHEAALLIEVARACGHEAYFVPRSVTEVEVLANEIQLASIGKKLTPALRLFRLRQWEALAEAVRAVGGEPSQTLLNALARARKRVAALARTSGEQNEKVDPRNN